MTDLGLVFEPTSATSGGVHGLLRDGRAQLATAAADVELDAPPGEAGQR
ncbi:hypothetical protein ACQPW3_15510 [Actinosynnema sp. CA-248983]